MKIEVKFIKKKLMWRVAIVRKRKAVIYVFYSAESDAVKHVAYFMGFEGMQ